MKSELERKLQKMEAEAMNLIDQGRLDDAAVLMYSVEQARHAAATHRLEEARQTGFLVRVPSSFSSAT